MPTPRAAFALAIARAVEDNGLTPKQAELALRYVLDEDTSGNKTKSALVTYDTESKDTAYNMARETLAKPGVRTYVQQLLEESGFGVEVRSAQIARIGTGNLKTTKVLTHRDKDGEVTGTQEITAEVPASVQLKAIVEANKLEGRHEQAQASIRLAEREYTAQRKKLIKEAGLPSPMESECR